MKRLYPAQALADITEARKGCADRLAKEIDTLEAWIVTQPDPDQVKDATEGRR